ncbi:MAG: DUF1513 domain-containing protein [Parvibaculaceae bacterium]
MAIDRRLILKVLAAAVAASMLPTRGRAATPPLYVSCRMNAANEASAVLFSRDGAELFSTILPARGHDSVARPLNGEIAVFARRPGNWFIVIDGTRKQLAHTIIAREGRHFYGHGAYTADGRILYATENDTRTGDGYIGIYDATNGYARIGEFSSRGVGPHDLAFLPGSGILAIANGGLRTLPESGREVLNPDDIHPNVALVNVMHDETLAVLDLGSDYSGLSIRHMAIAPDRTIAFGCQQAGDPSEMPPLVGLVSADGKIRLLDMPELDLMRMNNYVGSIALDAAGTIIAATSPQGGSVALFDRITGNFIARREMSDVCGVAPLTQARDFMLTSGNAGMRELDLSRETLDRIGGPAMQRWIWDNHILPL